MVRESTGKTGRNRKSGIAHLDMKDKKHLSQDKVKYLAKNLKAAFFNTKPKSRIRKPKSEQFYKYQRESPRRRNPIFNLYNPEPHVPTSTLPYPFPPQPPPPPQTPV